MKKIRILHVLGSLNFSGQEIMMENSSSYMKDANIKPFILSTGHNIGPAYNILKKGHEINHISFAKHKIFGPLPRFLAFFSLLNFLSKNKFHIIHIHTEANFFKICFCAILSGHKNIVRTVHNVFFSNLIMRIRRKLILKLCKFFNVKFISNSKTVAKNELKNYNLKLLILDAFYNESKYFYNYDIKKKSLRKKIKISSNKLVLLSVGNCSAIKNHNLILKSLSILPKKLDWIYIHVGDEDINKSERKLSKQLNIQNKCKFLGAKHDFSRYAFISDIYIMSSLVEGLGMATIEASAIGLIPILTKVPGNNEILKKIKGTIGIELNPISLKKAILKISLMKKEKRLKLSFLIHQQIKKYYSRKNIYQYIKYYKSI